MIPVALRTAVKRVLARYVLVIEFCQDCGRRQPLVWTADDALWARVAGRHDGGGVLCPECFDRRAQALGLFLRWRPVVEEHASERPGCKARRYTGPGDLQDCCYPDCGCDVAPRAPEGA